jgi:GNAT superfamily N-acetyltransferase
LTYHFQYPSTAHSLRLALADDAFYQTMLGAADSNTKMLDAYLDYAMQEALEFGQLTLCARPDQGAAIWSLPVSELKNQAKNDAKKAFLLTHMGLTSLNTYQAITGFMSQQAQGIVNDNDWYLSILGIHPSQQGKGLGKQLLMPALKQADNAGKACYLETFTPANMSFYARLGFVACHQAYEPTCQHHYWVMRRQPQRN